MNIYKQFFRYVSQSICGMVGVSFYILVDTLFISMAAKSDGITVLNLALPLYGLIFAIGSMIGVGAATNYSISKAKNNREADDYLFNGLFFSLIFAIPFVIAGLFYTEQAISIMGGDKNIISLGKEYFNIFLLFAPFFMMNFVINAFVRNDNDSGRAMIGTLSGSIFNIIFDYIFMFLMGMGLKGAALATAASPIVNSLICLTHFLKKDNNLKLCVKKPSFIRLGQTCKLGISAFIGELSSAVTTAVYNFIILDLVGNVGVAAYGIIANMALVGTAIFNGIAQGAQPLLSKYYGLGNEKKVKKLQKLGVVFGFCVAVILIGIIYFNTTFLVSLFNSEKSVELTKYAYIGLRIYFVGYIFAGFNIVSAGYFGATDKGKEVFITSILRGVIFIVFFSLILSAYFGINGVWLSFGAAEFLTAFVTVYYLIRNRGKKDGICFTN